MLSKIIYGKKGCGSSQKALFTAKQALCLKEGTADCNCKSCTAKNHPDLLILDGVKGEDIDTLLSFSKNPPLIATTRVVVMEDFDKVLPVTQTKLLKLLEEQPQFCLIATAVDKGKVLDTVKSRTESIYLNPLSKKAFMERGFDEVLYYVTEGYVSLVTEREDLVPCFSSVREAFKSRSESALFKALSMANEKKGSSSFFDLYPESVSAVFRYMLALPFLLVGDGKGRWRMPDVLITSKAVENEIDNYYHSVAFSKADFFTCICKIGNTL